MKNLYALIAFFCISSTIFAQTDCHAYVPTEQGSKWEITSYSGKGKVTGTSTNELISKVENGNDMTFTIKSISYDKKGKEVYENTFDSKCVDGKFQMSMAMKMNGADMGAYQNMDVEVDASDFGIPSMDSEAGTKLDDGKMTVKMGGSSGMGLNMTIFITDRSILKKESLTTSAGTFDCLVLSQKVSMKMMINIETSSKEWYAEDVGMVRSESYNKKGKLMGYSVLTSLEAK